MTLQSAAKQLADAIAADLAKANKRLDELVQRMDRYEQGESPISPSPSPSPLPSPEPEPTPPSTGWLAREPKADAHKLSANAREQDLVDALKSGRDVLLKAGAEYVTSSTLRMTHGDQLLGVWGEGNRPSLESDGFRDGQALLDIVEAPKATVSGIRPLGVEKTLAIYVGPGCDDLLLEDIDIDGFTDGVKMLGGDGPRIAAPTVHRCIIRNLVSRDPSRNVTGIYAEGTDGLTITGCAFDEIGTDARSNQRQAIYTQKGKNSRVWLDGNLFAHCESKAFQLRTGGDVFSNLILWCPIESYARGEDSNMDGNVVMYGASGLYAWDMDHANIRNNVFAHGVEGSDGYTQHAIRLGADRHTVTGNRVFDWSDGGGWWVANKDKTGEGDYDKASNRVLDSLEHGDMQSVVDAAVSRPRGEWGDDIAIAVNAVQEAAG